MSLTIADLITKMPSAFLPEKAQGVNAIIQFNFSGAEPGQWNAEIKNGTLKVAQGTHPSPSLTVSADSADYLRIFNRELDPMQAFMQGKLKMQGDLGLAMKLSQFFKPL